MLFRRRSLSFVALVLAFIAQAYAQAPASAPQTKPQKRFVMWKVTSPSNTVFLVGSMHVMAKDVYPLPADVEKAFAGSKVLVVELDAKHIDQSKMQALIQQNALYPAEDSLSKHLSPETSAALEEFCKKYEVPRQNLEPLRPWFVSTMVSLVAMQKSGADFNSGIDMHFLGGIKEPQRIAELETAEYQIGLLANRPADEQEKALAYSLKNIDKVHELEKAYLAGDTDTILKIMSDTPFSDFVNKLVYGRSVGMADKIDVFLKGKEPHFVVVGAGHVIGDKGIAKLLEQKGYKVERMSYDW